MTPTTDTCAGCIHRSTQDACCGLTGTTKHATSAACSQKATDGATQPRTPPAAATAREQEPPI